MCTSRHFHGWLAGFAALVLLAAVPAPAAAGAAQDAVIAAKRIDGLLAGELFHNEQDDDAAVDMAPLADDETFLRRVTFDLVGELPTVEELTAFALDPSPRKRKAVVERLLADPRYGRQWARYWRDVMLYRRNDDRAMLTSASVVKYLSEAFNENRPWDEIARDFITARGSLSEDGRTALLAAQWNETVGRAAEVSRILLGVQIQCAQCHDHKTDRWKREQFHHMAAFFPRMRIRPVRVDGKRRGFEMVSVDKMPRRRRGGEIEYRMPDLENPTAPGKRMQPVFFLTGQKIDFGVSDAERRERLADWLTSDDDPWFAMAFVNRIWGELVGEGFYEPVDDIGPDRTSSAPQTSQFLASRFAAHGYDIKWLFRTITATEAYGRESRPRRNAEQTPFTACCTQRLRADELFNALTSALDIDEEIPRRGNRRLPAARAAARSPRGQFNRIFDFDPSLPREEVTGSIPQALALMNTSVIERQLRAKPGSILGRLLDDTSDNEQVVLELYLRTLAREPSDAELKTSLDYIKQVGNRKEAFEDLLWALINSTDFLHRE